MSIKPKFCLLIFVAIVNVASAQTPKPNILAPGYNDLRFTAPKPGSYQLPILGTASDGQVLDSEGQATTLHKLMGNDAESGKIVVLSFIYSTCSDINGCPLATAVFHKIKDRLQHEPELAKKLRLLTLSFNPEHDTPALIKEYGATLQGNGVDWLFLTTRSEVELQPILQAYKQSIEKIYDAKGKFTNTFNHNLRVYLIDERKQLRNVYNSELLHVDILISDIKTLLLPQVANPTTGLENRKPSNLFGAGDNKQSYENKNYQTHSVAINLHKGQVADLLTTINKTPLGLPPVPTPKSNPITLAKINLGRKLFYDRRLSLNNTFSCAMCHIPEQGFTNNEMATAVGVEGRTVKRNSPTLYNVAYMQALFHDGRESTLENQVWGPLLAENEMANPSIGYVLNKIKANHDYDGLFEQTFGTLPSVETIGMALASYERALNSANSPFDRWYFSHDQHAITNKAKNGFQLFNGKAGCSQCHSLTQDYAVFSDQKYHNTGIGYADAMHNPAASSQRVQIAPGEFANVPTELIASVAETKPNDLGRYEITQNPKDRWLYKTPTLRNINLTAPYMHNGSIASLREVVEFYNRGGIVNENLDSLIKPLNLTASEIADLTAFLESLTGDNVKELVSDAFASPIGERR